MKKILLYFLLLITSITGFAQQNDIYQWIRSGGTTMTRPETVHDLATDSQNNIYAIARVGYRDYIIDGVPHITY